MDPRHEVAREAARLLYTGASEEYMHAKEQAAQSLGIETKPSNHEVAVELDLLADEIEGKDRAEFIIKMRGLALGLMSVLSDVKPVLRGSVWRGTARKGSDIDIDVYSNEPGEVKRLLEDSYYEVSSVEENVAASGRETSRSTHIKVLLEDEIEGEVVVRPVEEHGLEVRCEVYGDIKKGLRFPELEKLMNTDPLRKFVPGRRYR
jgi:predicted nucleotidyltransferase